MTYPFKFKILLLTYLFGGMASGMVALLSTFLMTHSLTAEIYGKGMLFISLMNILYLLSNAGMDQVFVRFFYEPKYKNNMPVLLYRCLLIGVLSFLIVSTFCILFHVGLLHWLELQSPGLISMLLLATVLLLLFRFMQLIPRLREQAKIYNLTNFFTQLLFLLIFILTLYLLGQNYWCIIISQIVSIALVLSWLIILYHKELFFSSLKTEAIFEPRELKEFLKYGTPSLFSLSLTWLFVNLDKFFILKWSNYYELGIYTAAFALSAPLELLQLTFNTAWAPRMNQMLIHSPVESKAVFSLTFEKLNFVLTVVFLILVLGKDWLVLLLGPNFHDAADIYPWLLFCPYFRTLSEVVFAGIVKSKKTVWNVFFSLCAVGANCLGCFLLIPYLGGKGAAISVGISFGVFFIARLLIAFRYYSFKVTYFKFIIYTGLIGIFIAVPSHQLTRLALFILITGYALLLERKWLRDAVSSDLIPFKKALKWKNVQ